MINFEDSAVSTSDLTTYTFSSLDFGTEASNRYLIVATSGTGGTGVSVSTVTIGSVSATLVNPVSNPNVTTQCGVFAIAPVPTGTTGDVVVTFNAGKVRAGCSIYSVTGIQTATPTDTASGFTASVDNPAPTDTINVNPKGFVIAYAWVPNNVVIDDVTWTGVNEDFFEVVESNSYQTGGHQEITAGESGRTITCTFTTNGAGVTQSAMFATSWYFSSNGGFFAAMQ